MVKETITSNIMANKPKMQAIVSLDPTERYNAVVQSTEQNTLVQLKKEAARKKRKNEELSLRVTQRTKEQIYILTEHYNLSQSDLITVLVKAQDDSKAQVKLQRTLALLEKKESTWKESKVAVFNVRITPFTKERINNLAKRYGLFKSDFITVLVREAISEYNFKKEKTKTAEEHFMETEMTALTDLFLKAWVPNW